MSIVTAVQQIAQVVSDATGFHTVTDPTKIVLPCVLVTPPDLDFTIMSGGGQATFTVMILAPAPWNLDALTTLSDMLTAVLNIDGMVAPTGAKPGQYTAPKGGEVPCYVLTYPMAIDMNPN